MSANPRLEKVKEILESHKGKKNQISAEDIGPKIGIHEDATHVQVRELIRETIEEYNLPVAAGSKGYYLIQNEEELKEYLENIDGRIEEMRNRKKLVKDAYSKYYR